MWMYIVIGVVVIILIYFFITYNKFISLKNNVEEAFSRGQREGEDAFYRVWTGREAYAKYTGEGFFGEALKELSVVKASNIKCFVLNDMQTCETVNEGKTRTLYCSICTEKDKAVAREVEIVEF